MGWEEWEGTEPTVLSPHYLPKICILRRYRYRIFWVTPDTKITHFDENLCSGIDRAATHDVRVTYVLTFLKPKKVYGRGSFGDEVRIGVWIDSAEVGVGIGAGIWIESKPSHNVILAYMLSPRCNSVPSIESTQDKSNTYRTKQERLSSSPKASSRDETNVRA